MKYTELMIGDYIYDDNGNVQKILSIEKIGESGYILTITSNKEGYNRLTKPENIEPIPLNEDILLKNWFVQVPQSNVYKWRENTNCISIDLDGYQNDYVTNMSWMIEGNLKYVHKLQHAIAESEIDKEIIL